MKTTAVLILGLLAACTSSPVQEPLEAPIRVLLLGDSISIGYTRVVKGLLEGEAVVIRPTNKKGGAENCAGTTKGVENIGRWLELDGGGWDVIHFNFGLHDMKRVNAETGKNSNDADDPHQASPEVYERQLRRITERLVGEGARLVFATTTPVPSGGVRPHREPGDIGLYNGVARGVMEEFGVEIDDLYGVVVGRLEEVQKPVDVHFTKEGSALLGEEVVRSIRRAAGWVEE